MNYVSQAHSYTLMQTHASKHYVGLKTARMFHFLYGH